MPFDALTIRGHGPPPGLSAQAGDDPFQRCLFTGIACRFLDGLACRLLSGGAVVVTAAVWSGPPGAPGRGCLSRPLRILVLPALAGWPAGGLR